MKRLAALILWVGSAGLIAQSECPQPLDYDGDGAIVTSDLLNLLNFFGFVDADFDGIEDAIDNCISDQCGNCNGPGYDVILQEEVFTFDSVFLADVEEWFVYVTSVDIIDVGYCNFQIGCTDDAACNYSPEAIVDSGDCVWAIDIYADGCCDCDGVCFDDLDMDGVCDEQEVLGCTYASACNYDPGATEESGQCDFFSCAGCADSTACNWTPEAPVSIPELCQYPSNPYRDCFGECMNDANDNLICDEFEGCTDQEAMNYSATAVLDDGTCEYAFTCGQTILHEGESYLTTMIGDQCWFAENLRYLPAVSPPSQRDPDIARYYVYGYSGIYVDEAIQESSYSSFGALYNSTAMSSNTCPSGWKVPSTAEAEALIDYAGGTAFAGLTLKANGNDTIPWDGINSEGFTATPGGQLAGCGSYTTGFQDQGNRGVFWTSDLDRFGVSSNSDYVQIGLIGVGPGGGCCCSALGTQAASIRCIKDTE